jgi:hypothetical protein
MSFKDKEENSDIYTVLSIFRSYAIVGVDAIVSIFTNN